MLLTNVAIFYDSWKLWKYNIASSRLLVTETQNFEKYHNRQSQLVITIEFYNILLTNVAITLKEENYAEETFARGKIHENEGINFRELLLLTFFARINFRELEQK